MNEKITTLKDIAKALNLSISTVSRAISNHPDISENTRKRVLQLVSKMDYQPNQLAINLLHQQSNFIGVIVPKISYYLYAMTISGIEDEAERHGYKLIICQTNESSQRESEILDELLKIRVAGILVSVSSTSKGIQHFERILKKMPLVFFNRDCDINASKVVINNAKSAYDLTEHLIGAGRKKIAFVAGPKMVQISNKRLQGYRDCLKNYGFKYLSKYVKHSPFSRMGAKNAILDLINLPTPPDAIIAFSDQLAMGGLQAIREKGLKIPDDIALAGFNNEPANELIDPPLTSVEQPAFEMGRRATALLFEHISLPNILPQKIVLSSTLITRSSTAEDSGSSYHRGYHRG